MRDLIAGFRLALMNARLALRTRAAFFFSFVFPLIFLFAYGAIFAKGEPLVVAYLFGPVVVLQIMAAAFFGLGLRMVAMRERGSLRRYRLAPIGPAAMVWGSLLANYFLLLPAVALLFIVAHAAFHMSLALDWWRIFWIVTIGDFAFAGFGLIIGAMADTAQEADVFSNAAFFPLLFLSGATIPLAALPHGLQRVAAFLPATYLVSAFQSVMMRTPGGMDVAAFAALLIAGLCGFWMAARLFRWEKEERIPTGRKLSAAASLVPFLLIGLWMNSRPATFAAWNKTLNAANAAASPTPPPAPPNAAPRSPESSHPPSAKAAESPRQTSPSAPQGFASRPQSSRR